VGHVPSNHNKMENAATPVTVWWSCPWCVPHHFTVLCHYSL